MHQYNILHCVHNGFSPLRRQAIIWTNAAILSIRPQAAFFFEMLPFNLKVFIQENALENVIVEMAAMSRGLNVLNRATSAHFALMTDAIS